MGCSKSIITAAWLAAGLAAGLASSGAFAAVEHLDMIERECGKQLRMAPSSCKCMRDRAATLKDGQQAFVAAVVVKDKAAQASAQQKLTAAEQSEAVSFITNMRSQCAR